MKENRQIVLIVGVDAETFAKVAPMLEREAVDVDRFPRARASLELLSAVAFDTLFVRYPLEDMPIEDFLAQVRRPGSLCQRTPLLLVTEDERVEEARRLIGKGANRVVPLSMEAEQLQSVVSGLLEVAPRLAMRIMASLEINLDEGKTLAVCQTENVSSSGMLIRAQTSYPVGTRLRFEFNLPVDPRPISGTAEVVRHTVSGRESVKGVGVRFLAFDGDGRARFDRYLGAKVEVTSGAR